MTLRNLYFIGALLGAAIPWYFNLQAIEQGVSMLDIPAMGLLAFANPIAASLSSELLVLYLFGIIWLVVEARRVRMKHWWFYLLFGTYVAWASGFLLFLAMRERQLNKDSPS